MNTNGIFCYSVLGQPINYFPWPASYQATLHPQAESPWKLPDPHHNFVPKPSPEGTPFGGSPDESTAPPPYEPSLDPKPVEPPPTTTKKEGSVWPLVAFGVGGVALFMILSR